MPTTRLSMAQERFLLACAAGMSEDGAPPTLGEIQARAEEILRDGGDRRPLGAQWAANFAQRHGLETRQPDGPRRLDAAQERAVAEWARAQASIRSPPTLEEIREQAQEILAEAGDLKRLSPSWAWCFVKRHPAVETSEGVKGGARLDRVQEAVLVEWAREQCLLGSVPLLQDIRRQAQEMLAQAGDARAVSLSWGFYFAKRHPKLERGRS